MCQNRGHSVSLVVENNNHLLSTLGVLSGVQEENPGTLPQVDPLSLESALS